MDTLRNPPQDGKEGFTLLELLIVVGIVAVLSVALVLVLNPAETLRKSRDAQRIADLNSLKMALSLYIAGTTTTKIVYLGGINTNVPCKATPTPGGYAANTKIFYSLPILPTSVVNTITDNSLDRPGGGFANRPGPQQVSLVNLNRTNGTGWIPVNLDNLTGGSPISAYPVDPTNTISDRTNVRYTDFVYRYACAQTPLSFEIDARFESIAYATTTNKHLSDGGNSNLYYEVGTSLKILGATPTVFNF